MKRIPILATLIVAAAVAVMIGLGVWQLQRAEWKEGLIARYDSTARLPEIAWPSVSAQAEELYFRRAAGFCTEVTGWRSVAGRNRSGQTGWSHIAACRTGGLEGPGMQVDMGWSRSHEPPAWSGGEVRGVIAPDREHRIRLISDEPAPGLEPSARPDPASLPNNHLMYAFQWFFFALTALVIFAIAVARRRRTEGADVEERRPRP